MSARKASELIQTLSSGSFKAECPHCEDDFALQDAGLFYMDRFTTEADALYQEQQSLLTELRRQIRETPKQIVRVSHVGAESVNTGRILERLAPSLPGFPLKPVECRSLSDPIDYIGFRGIARGNTVHEIAFIEIKSGGRRLTMRQKAIRSAVEQGNVAFERY